MRLKFKENLFYGWVIVFSIILVSLILTGTRFSFGVFFKPLAGEFDLTRATTSSLYSVFMLLCIPFTIAGGWALDKYGPRLVFLLMGLFTCLCLLLTSVAGSLWQLYLTYSLLLSIGTAPLFPVLFATVSRWFDKKRGLAMGIAGSGSRLGQIFWAPFCTLLISHFNWRIACIITGLIVLFIVGPISRLLRNDPSEIGAVSDGAEHITTMEEEKIKEEQIQLAGLSLSQALRTTNYWFIWPAWLINGFGNILVFTHIIPYATDFNISAMQAATLISVIGLFGLPSGILIGKISDVIHKKTPLLAGYLLRAGALAGLIWAHELWMFYICAIAFGISIGGIGIILNSLSVDIFGRRSIGIIMSTLDVAWALGSAIGSFMGGWVYDVYNSYSIAFLIATTGSVITALLISLIKVEAKQAHV